MTSELLHEALGDLDDALIEEVEAMRSKPRKMPRRAIYAVTVAACVCVVSVALLAVHIDRLRQPLDMGTDGSSGSPEDINTEVEPGEIKTEPYLDNSVGTTTVQAGNAGTTASTKTTSQGQTQIIERPTVIVRITQWNDGGFTGKVTALGDTTAVTVGDTVTVQFAENMGFEVTTNGLVTYHNRVPTEEDLPIDTVVHVRFTSLTGDDQATDDGKVLCAEAIGIKAVIE